MLRLLAALALVASCSAFAPATPALQLSKVASSRAAGFEMMAKVAPAAAKKAPAKKAVAKKVAPKKVIKKVAPKPAAKKVVKKAAPKPAARKVAAPKPAARKVAPKKAAPKKSFGKSPVGKGGILPWITNEPGTYGKPLMLSSVDFTGKQGDAWIGWGFFPASVKALYPKGKKGLL